MSDMQGAKPPWIHIHISNAKGRRPPHPHKWCYLQHGRSPCVTPNINEKLHVMWRYAVKGRRPLLRPTEGPFALHIGPLQGRRKGRSPFSFILSGGLREGALPLRNLLTKGQALCSYLSVKGPQALHCKASGCEVTAGAAPLLHLTSSY